MKLWIGNVAPEASNDDILALIKKYAGDLTCTNIERVDGDGSRPAAMLDFSTAPFGAVEKIALRLSGMHWKGRTLVVQSMMR
jgi:hypothetical protein